jgi:uncharacterized protein
VITPCRPTIQLGLAAVPLIDSIAFPPVQLAKILASARAAGYSGIMVTPPESRVTRSNEVSLPSVLRLRFLAARTSTTLVLTLVGYIAVLYALQDQLIFPGVATQGTLESRVRPRYGCELLQLASKSGQRVAALYGPAVLPDGRPHPEPRSCPALLYFYGNAMCLAYAENEFERFRRLGANVLIPDYVGYGQSSGKASELGCRETAETAMQALVDRGFAAGRIIACGWSLGGAVAIDLAARHRLGGLAAFSTFTSTQEMALVIFPLPLPLPGWLFVHKFDSLAKLPQVSCPVLLGHGRRDTLVPFAMMQKLAAAAKGPLRTFVIDAAEHNDFYVVGTPQIDFELGSFVKSLNR